MACVDVARAMGYEGEVDGRVRERVNRVIGTLVRLVRR